MGDKVQTNVTPMLDAACISAYGQALLAGTFNESEIGESLCVGPAEVARIGGILLELKLLEFVGNGFPLLPASPDLAEAELSDPLEREIRDRQDTLTQIRRELHAVGPVYRQFSQTVPLEPAIRIIDDPAKIRWELAVAARQCTDEALTMQPGGGRSSTTLKEACTRDLALLERGARLRTLYQHTARASLATRMYVRQVSELGAEVRISTHTFERVIIFDQKVAFIAQARRNDLPPGAALATDPTVVGFLCRTFENLWLSSQPFEPNDALDPKITVDLLRMTILRHMAAGLKDDVIARRLGMATRTCRRYMTGIMDDLGATSRFQVGVKACQLGLLTVDDIDMVLDSEPFSVTSTDNPPTALPLTLL